jgi:putative oxidoreductase
MPRRLFTHEPISPDMGISLIRILVGLLMTYHGTEIFEAEAMTRNAKFLADTHFPWPTVLAWLGKGSEFICGILLVFGLFTRLAILPIVATMLTITFGLGQGKFWMDDQHPFLFAVLLTLLFFTGPGKFSLDAWRARKVS